MSEKRWQSDMDSWHRHLLRCMENPEMWEEGSEDLEAYRFWNGGISSILAFCFT